MARTGNEQRYEVRLDKKRHADLIAFVEDCRADGRSLNDVMIDIIATAMTGAIDRDEVGERLADAITMLADAIVDRQQATPANFTTRKRGRSPTGTDTWEDATEPMIESTGIDMSRPRPRPRQATANTSPAPPAPEPEFDEAAARRILLDSVRSFGQNGH